MEDFITILTVLGIWAVFGMIWARGRVGKVLRTGGWMLQASTDEKAIWWDNDKHHDGQGKKGWGLMLALRWGYLYMPVLYPWQMPWRVNRWTSGKHWFAVKIPMTLPWASVALGRYGLYLGGKVYGVDHHSQRAWAKPGDIRPGNQALALSMSIRRARIK